VSADREMREYRRRIIRECGLTSVGDSVSLSVGRPITSRFDSGISRLTRECGGNVLAAFREMVRHEEERP
jgi:hypothetical protein